jgi:aryl-alcohol dehydrogenase-like predicted oxidoreductase
VRLQPFLADHRTDYFLATKTGERTAGAARAELERSLDRLGVDQVDLIQLHNLVEPDEFETAHGPGGVVEGLIAAREEGLVRFIGVTGHGTRIPDMHLRSLDRFDFDSVLLPYNATMMRSEAYAASFDALLARCTSTGVAVQTIKSVARRRWAADSTDPHFAWYEPLPEGPALRRSVAFVLNRAGVFLNSSSDARLLPAILDAASSGLPMPTTDEIDADIAAFDMAPLFDGGALERM